MPAPIRVVHEEDPKKLIWKDCGKLLEGLKPLADRVLVVMYERTNQGEGKEARTTGGIIMVKTQSRTSAAEQDKYQGRLGLVMALGPLAFKSDATHDWGGVVPKVNDWVMFDSYSNFSPFDLPNDRRARFVQDIAIEAIVPEETFDAIW